MTAMWKRLLVLFALLGVVGTAAAFRGGALPGPAVGVSALYCALTGCTMTGQQVFSGVTTDISTGTNEDLTLAPNGTGNVVAQNSSFSLNGMTCPNSGSALTTQYNCNNGPASWTSSTSERVSIWATSGSALVSLRSIAAAGNEGIEFNDSANATNAYISFYNSSFSDADEAGSLSVLTIGKPVRFLEYNAGVAGTVKWSFRANAGASGAAVADVVAIDGVGNIKLDSGATRTRGTITLSAGTGTATVTSGAVCVCSDTTANASVRCAVTTTTLTATGTGTDVIAYLCL